MKLSLTIAALTTLLLLASVRGLKDGQERRYEDKRPWEEVWHDG